MLRAHVLRGWRLEGQIRACVTTQTPADVSVTYIFRSTKKYYEIFHAKRIKKKIYIFSIYYIYSFFVRRLIIFAEPPTSCQFICRDDGASCILTTIEFPRSYTHLARNNRIELFQKLICERLYSIDGIRWSPNNELLCIWCSSPAEPKLLIYSTVLEKSVVALTPLEMYKEFKGIENVEWAPSGQLLAVTGLNEMVISLILYFISSFLLH